jgi:hypothetical protein
MIERAGGTCLATEALERLSILALFLGQELESDVTPQRGVLRLVDLAHASLPNEADNSETARNYLVRSKGVSLTRLRARHGNDWSFKELAHFIVLSE